MKNFNKETIGGLCIIALLIIVVIIIVANKFSNEMPKKNSNNVNVEQEPIADEVKEDTNPTDNTEKKEIVDAADVVPELGEVIIRNSEKYIRYSLKEIRNDDNQMAELFSYWNDYKLEAVADLIRLERVRTLTDSLMGTFDFYYYGDVNENNLPEGKGLAIYANNAYYFGDWEAGLREGDGMWIKIFPDKAGTVGSFTGVLEHQYSGNWKNDMPNGSGQEHYTYDPELITDELSINNAMGSFKNGYYDGEMLLMIMEKGGNTYDWIGTAQSGVFKIIENKPNQEKQPVLAIGPNSKEGQQEFYYMTSKENMGWGVDSLKK